MKQKTTNWAPHSARWARRPASRFPYLVFLVLTAACSSERIPVTFEFVATWDGRPIQCDTAGTGLTDLRLLVSNLRLTDSTGKEHALAMIDDGRWQQAGVALIDLENGTGNCLNGSLPSNSSIRAVADESDIAGLRFTVGVPFKANHANPLLAQPPLDDAAMHWHWRSGYKFLRAGIRTETDSFWIHLGSTGCEGTVQKITGCRYSNRVDVDLPRFRPRTDRIEIDMSALFRQVDLTDGLRSDCSSGPAETACKGPFAALGLQLDGDDREQPRRQSVFRVRR
jgi:uncharacterized repeat protein (TIGR04052 family)